MADWMAAVLSVAPPGSAPWSITLKTGPGARGSGISPYL